MTINYLGSRALDEPNPCPFGNRLYCPAGCQRNAKTADPLARQQQILEGLDRLLAEAGTISLICYDSIWVAVWLTSLA